MESRYTDPGPKLMPYSDRETSTRATLSPAWQEMQQRIDWMSVPGMADYVNGLVSGKRLDQGGHWAIYARDRHVAPLLARRKVQDPACAGLTMVSMACGSAHIERALIVEFEWPISSLLGLEYDDVLRSQAREAFRSVPHCRSEFSFYDFNHDLALDSRFDLVFTCHSIHHASDIERLLALMSRILKPDGLLIGIDYFGPTRFQIEHDVLPIIEELFSMLPPALRRDLRDPEGRVQERFAPASIKEVRDADLSESVRSSDLRTLLFSNFRVVDLKPMGGTLLRWLLQYRAGNFDPSKEEHVAIARLLQFIEGELIALRRIKSDDLFFALQQSDRLQV